MKSTHEDDYENLTDYEEGGDTQEMPIRRSEISVKNKMSSGAFQQSLSTQKVRESKSIVSKSSTEKLSQQTSPFQKAKAPATPDDEDNANYLSDQEHNEGKNNTNQINGQSIKSNSMNNTQTQIALEGKMNHKQNVMTTNFQLIDDDINLRSNTDEQQPFGTPQIENRQSLNSILSGSQKSRGSRQEKSRGMSNYTAKKENLPEEVLDEDNSSSDKEGDSHRHRQPFDTPEVVIKKSNSAKKSVRVLLTEQDLHRNKERRNQYLKQQVTSEQIRIAEQNELALLQEANKKASQAGFKPFLLNEFVQIQFVSRDAVTNGGKQSGNRILTPIQFRTS